MATANKNLDIRFTADPTNVNLTEAEVATIENQITAQVMQILNDNNLGELAWLEAGGYVKFSKSAVGSE